MARPSPWNSPTKAIRVPEHAAEACLALARKLDSTAIDGGEANVQNPTEGFDLPIYKPDCSYAAIKNGLEEGYITGEPVLELQDPSKLGPYLVTIGDERYLVQTPENLTTKQWLDAAAAEADYWQLVANLSPDQQAYVFSKLVQAWGQDWRLKDVA